MSVFEKVNAVEKALAGMKSPYKIWLMYLRKSRQDDPDETVEEVLAKHEVRLQALAMRELGRRIDEKNIYREIGSGEKISERVEIQKVLARIEDPAVAGVLVVDAARLSRGDLEDCGRIISDFRFSKTLVVSEKMTYDLENKMHRKFFQDELLRASDFLEYTKDILWAGRISAVMRGCYIATRPPYGYNKIKIGKDHTLEPNENADVVRLVFELYTREGLTPGKIAQRLNELEIPAPKSDKWVKATIRSMLRNEHYAGKVVFNKIKKVTMMENGKRVTKKLSQAEDEVIIAEGKHPAIIDPETWKLAQELVAQNPRVKHTHELKNPFGGILRCGKCGNVLYVHPYKHAEHRYDCRSIPRCYKSVKYSVMEEAIIFALEHSELPALELKVKNGDGDAAKIQKRLVEKLEKQMQEYRDQEEHQFELLETRVYTQEVFERRNAILREKMQECEKQIYHARASIPENVDYQERVASLKTAIKALKDPKATPTEKNRLLKAIVERIDLIGSPSDRKNKKRQNRTGSDPFTLNITLRL